MIHYHIQANWHENRLPFMGKSEMRLTDSGREVRGKQVIVG